MKYTEIAENHIKAAQEGQWDYPNSLTTHGKPLFKTKEEVIAELHRGATIEMLYNSILAEYGTITGFALNHLGYTSNSTRAALRKGFKKFLS